jgi:hypothetical protein
MEIYGILGLFILNSTHGHCGGEFIGLFHYLPMLSRARIVGNFSSIFIRTGCTMTVVMRLT